MTVIQRCWYLTVRDRGAFGLLAEANYADTTIDRSLFFRKASGRMLRYPDSVCREALSRINDLEGTTLVTTDPQRYNSICGGSSGCTHISHLVQEAALTLDIYQKRKSK